MDVSLFCAVVVVAVAVAVVVVAVLLINSLCRSLQMAWSSGQSVCPSSQPMPGLVTI